MDYSLAIPNGDGSPITSFFTTIPSPSGSLLWAVFFVLSVILGFTTLVLYYHWMRYAFGNKMVIFAQVLYTLVLIACLIVMLSAIFSYV